MNSLRNEKARQRHRQRKKDQCGCISVPASAVASASSKIQLPRRELNEVNHFGWAVCGKSVTDPEFERLMQYNEKPALQGLDEDKSSTYVLCLQDGTLVAPPTSPLSEKPSDGRFLDNIAGTDVKATQTSFQEIDLKGKREKKKNLISEFFFTPTRERSRSRSPSAGRSKLKSLGKLTDDLRMFIGNGNQPKTKKKDVKKKIGSAKIGQKKNVQSDDESKAGKEKLLRSAKTLPSKIGSKKVFTSNESESNNKFPEKSSKTEKQSVKFHLDPVKPIKSSSEQLLGTSNYDKKYYK